ncbi:MAG: DUF2203 family protein [Armatimonadetes bacterium]|nr:DUF2203 family protein [Armatimonadota bacterium]
MHFKLYTVEEANKTLDELSGLIRQFNSRRQDLIHVQVLLEGLRSQPGAHPDTRLKREIAEKEAELTAFRREMQAIHKRVEEKGILVRDYERGQVDFPAVVERQSAYLCWHLGEENVQYWHGPDDGFAGRKPLGNLSRGGEVSQ